MFMGLSDGSIDSSVLFGGLRDEDDDSEGGESRERVSSGKGKKGVKKKRHGVFAKRGKSSAVIPSVEDVERYGFEDGEDPSSVVPPIESAPGKPRRRRKPKVKPEVESSPPAHELEEFRALGVVDGDFEPEPVSGDGGGDEVSRSRKKQSLALIGAVVVLMCVALVAVAVRMDTGGGAEESPPVAASEERDTATPVVPDLDTLEPTAPKVPVATTSERVGVTVSSGMSDSGDVNKGDHSSGTDAIFGYDWAYYGLRSDAAANEFSVNKDNVGIAEKVAAGTTYELEVTPRVVGERYDARLTLIPPGGDPKVYDQVFTVKLVNGKYLVKSVETLS